MPSLKTIHYVSDTPPANSVRRTEDRIVANRAIIEELGRGLIIREDASFAALVRPSDSSEPVQRWFHYREGYTVDLCRRLFGPDESFVVDPFCGFGSTLVAAQRAGMPSAGLDVSPLAGFESVSTLRSADLVRQVDGDLRRQRIPLMRRYYEKPLRIALTIVASEGVSLVEHGEEVELSSYVVNFDDLFESYLRAVLRSRLENRGLRVLDGNRDGSKRLFDDAKEPQAQPDILIEASETKRRIVADAKYKEKTDRGDLNQAITYALSYRATDAILIHQCLPGKPIGRQRLGSINGMTLHTYGFDLASPDLDGEEQALADSIAVLFS